MGLFRFFIFCFIFFVNLFCFGRRIFLFIFFLWFLFFLFFFSLGFFFSLFFFFFGGGFFFLFFFSLNFSRRLGLVGNKIDLLEKPFQDIKCNVQISAKYATNIDKLKKIIIERINSFTSNHGVQNSSSVLYINQRQKELLLQCNSSISKAIDKVQNNEPEDLISDDLKEALSRLDEVTGRKINDEIITNIFAKFCIGK